MFSVAREEVVSVRCHLSVEEEVASVSASCCQLGEEPLELEAVDIASRAISRLKPVDLVHDRTQPRSQSTELLFVRGDQSVQNFRAVRA